MTDSARPILFSGEMVRAILAGRKTQTRRVIKSQPSEGWHPEVGSYAPTCVDRHGEEYPGSEVYGASDEDEGRIFPYGQPGDRLWVRETMHRDEAGPWHYSADCETVMVGKENETEMRVWAHHKEGATCVSIHMPRWASRITLEIAKVSVERVQEISNEDAIAEGCQGGIIEGYSDRNPADPYEQYAILWDKINAKRGFGWDVNPWVWVIEFQHERSEVSGQGPKRTLPEVSEV